MHTDDKLTQDLTLAKLCGLTLIELQHDTFNCYLRFVLEDNAQNQKQEVIFEGVFNFIHKTKLGLVPIADKVLFEVSEFGCFTSENPLVNFQGTDESPFAVNFFLITPAHAYFWYAESFRRLV